MATTNILSEFLDEYRICQTDETWRRMLECFATSTLGVHAVGIPKGLTGTIVNGKNDNWGFGLNTIGSGHKVILAYADPELFATNYGRRFNATVSARDLCRACLFNPDCVGIQINCATSENSIVIPREAAQSLMNVRLEQPLNDRREQPRSWWWPFGKKNR